MNRSARTCYSAPRPPLRRIFPPAEPSAILPAASGNGERPVCAHPARILSTDYRTPTCNGSREKTPMSVYNAGDFRKGIKVIVEGQPYEMVHCDFVKPGKGQALYKTKLRNMLTGTLLDITYRSGDSLEQADVRTSDGMYSYFD